MNEDYSLGYEDGFKAGQEDMEKQEKASSQPEQEPILVECGNCHEGLADMEHVCKKCLGAGWVNNPQRKEPEQEPVAWMSEHRFDELRKGFTVMTTLTKQRAFKDDVAIYTTQPQREPLTDENCTWKQHDDIHMPDTWEADCGAMWTFTEGGPKDNDMHYCPKCGKPAIEAAHGIKGST